VVKFVTLRQALQILVPLSGKENKIVSLLLFNFTTFIVLFNSSILIFVDCP